MGIASLRPMYRWASNDEAERQAAVNQWRRAIQVAAELGVDTRTMLRECADVLAHVHVGDTFNHRASSGLRYVLDPPGASARVHRHLDIGQGEVPWDDFFGTLHEVGFDGIMTACVFAGEDRADQSSAFMRQEMRRYVDQYRDK